MAVPFIAPMNYGRPKEARPHRFAYDYGTVDPGMFAPTPDRARAKRAPKRSIAYTIPLPDSEESMQGHVSGPNALALNTETLFSGGRDGVVKAWTVGAHGTTQRAAQAVHADWVNDVVAVNGGRTAVTASSDMTVRVWTPGSQAQTIGSHMDYVKALAYSEGRNTVVSGGLDRQIREWDIRESRSGPVCALNGVENASSVYTLACNSQGLVVSGSPETMVRVWDLRAGQQVTTLSGHTDHIRAVLLSADSELILSGSSDATVKMWSMRMRRCLSTYTQHTDSVWALCSTHAQFQTFHSASRDGMVAKTMGDTCVAVAKEPHGVVKLVANDMFVWTATKGPHLNRWRDVDVVQVAEHSGSVLDAGQGRAVDAIANHTRSISASLAVTEQTRRNTDRDDQFYDAQSQPGSDEQRDVASISAVLANSGNRPEANLTEPTDNQSNAIQPIEPGLMILTALHIDAASPGLAEAQPVVPALAEAQPVVPALAEAQPVAPARAEPEETIFGRHGLHRHRVLPNRRHVLAQDTAGRITVWDIMQCRCIHTVPECDDPEASGAFSGVSGRDFDAVAAALSTDPESVNSWCMVDTRTGVLTVHISEAQAWDAEVHVDDVDGVPPDAVRAMGDHERVNIGQWMLKRLFLPYARARVRRGLVEAADAAVLNRWAAQAPIAEVVSARVAPRTSANAEPGLLPSVVSPLEATAEQIGISKWAPVLKDSGEGQSTVQEQQQEQKETVPRHHHTPSIDTAKSTTPGTTPGTAQALAQDSAQGPAQGLTQGPAQGLTQGTAAKTEDGDSPASNGSAGKFINRLRSMRVRKQKSTLASPPPPLPIKDTSSGLDIRSPTSPTAPEPRDTFSEWAGPRYPTDTERTLALLQTPPASWDQLYAPAVCPRLPLPRNIGIMVFQDCALASGPFLIFRSTTTDAFTSGSESVLSVTNDPLVSFELCMPAWLVDLLLFNRLPAAFQEPPKISFVLAPAVGTVLPPFPNPSARLVANRMLRARKLAIYVVEKLGLALMTQPAPNYVSAVEACIRAYGRNVSVKDANAEDATEDVVDYIAVLERNGEVLGDAERAALDDVTQWRSQTDEYIGRPELYLHLSCRGRTAQPKTTLATIKTNVWKANTDVVVHYEWAEFVRNRITKAQSLATVVQANSV
ncbi:hypothetical protein GGH96_001851 [Coemansia sp. RSA 1972]|nr:hypothetical protein GGH96_001851 [Coemansia sp. RSA 1972]